MMKRVVFSVVVAAAIIAAIFAALGLSGGASAVTNGGGKEKIIEMSSGLRLRPAIEVVDVSEWSSQTYLSSRPGESLTRLLTITNLLSEEQTVQVKIEGGVDRVTVVIKDAVNGRLLSDALFLKGKETKKIEVLMVSPDDEFAERIDIPIWVYWIAGKDKNRVPVFSETIHLDVKAMEIVDKMGSYPSVVIADAEKPVVGVYGIKNHSAKTEWNIEFLLNMVIDKGFRYEVVPFDDGVLIEIGGKPYQRGSTIRILPKEEQEVKIYFPVKKFLPGAYVNLRLGLRLLPPVTPSK